MGTVLGLEGTWDQRRAAALVSALSELWHITIGSPLGDLAKDLELLRKWFDPVAQGQRLRRELAELDPPAPDFFDPGPPLTLSVGRHQWLITPEGRCALELFLRLRDRQFPLRLTDADTNAYVNHLALLYRDWSRHRLQSVVDLLSGVTKPLQIPAAGVVVGLLVARCTSDERALIRYSRGEVRDLIDDAFFKFVEAFAQTLAPSAKRKQGRLVSGWMVYEARRRLGDDFVVVEAKGAVPGKVWIRAEATSQVISTVVRDLLRGNRKHPAIKQVMTAFDRLVDELRAQLRLLAGHGLVHERPHETARLRALLLTELSRQSAEVES